MTALQGDILLAQTTRTVRPLELGLDMALEHVAGQVTRRAGGTAGAREARECGLHA